MASGSELLAALVIALSGAVLILLVAVARLRLRLHGETRRREDLGDGTVILAEGGRVRDLVDTEGLLPGAAAGARVDELLGAALGEGREAALGALARLTEAGESFRLLARTQTRESVEIIGTPRGGECAIVLRDAHLMAAEIERAERTLAARERCLSASWYERETIASMIESGAAIAWHRMADGSIAWCAGHVVSEEGSVSADEAVATIAARGPSGEEAEARIFRTRIEVLPPGGIEPLPLKVFEVLQPDGRRCGLAVDGSLAASAERTLNRFVQTMTETFAHLTIGLAIFDRTQTLVLFNPALAKMLQLDPAWLARRPTLRDLVDALRAARRIPETADFHGWRDRLLSLFDNTEAVDYEELWHLVDGSGINVLARPHPHGSLAFVFDDVSERMRLEQSYRQSVDLRHATLNRLDEGLAVFGADGVLQFVNDAFHEIWDTDGESVRPRMHARDVVLLCQGLTLETEVWRRMIGFITSDETRRAWSARVTLGSNRTLSTRIAPLPGGATMIVFADITDSERIALALRERNEALEAVEEMRTAVLDQISHRLRTPLNTIFGFGQLLSDPRFGELTAEQREYADGILEASGQLLDTIDDVTELASLQLDPLHDEGVEPPLAETLELTQQLLEKRAVEAGVSLGSDLPDAAIYVHCDAVRLRQIVFNMVAGAIQRSPSGTHIRLSGALLDDARAEIRVTETPGPGTEAATAFAEDGESLAFSVIRRMVTSEGGRFERRRGETPESVVTACSFPLAGKGEAPGASPSGPPPRHIAFGE